MKLKLKKFLKEFEENWKNEVRLICLGIFVVWEFCAQKIMKSRSGRIVQYTLISIEIYCNLRMMRLLPGGLLRWLASRQRQCFLLKGFARMTGQPFTAICAS